MDDLSGFKDQISDSLAGAGRVRPGGAEALGGGREIPDFRQNPGSVSEPILARIGRPEIYRISWKNPFLALWGDYNPRNLLKRPIRRNPENMHFWRNFSAKIHGPKLHDFRARFWSLKWEALPLATHAMTLHDMI